MIAIGCGGPALATAAMTAACGVALLAAGTQRELTFASVTNSVVVDVSVRQGDRSVLDLRPEDFRLEDNGVLQKLDTAGLEALPLDVTLILDTSDSINDAMFASLRRATAAVADHLQPTDRASLIVFDQHIRQVTGFEPGREGVRTDVLHAPRGLTALQDAVAASLITRVEPTRRRMAIVITDGGDVTSFTDERDVVDLAARSGVAVFAVAMTDGTSRAPVKPMNQPLFEALTSTTGGALTILQRDQDLSGTFIGAVDEFRTSYVLRYTPRETWPVGWHDLAVKVTRRGRYTVRARTGYFDALVETSQ